MTASLLVVLLGAAAPEACTLCHPQARVQFEESVHHREGILCSSCHGGDPAATTVERAHRNGFVGDPRRRDIPDLCGSCHSDIAKMRPYNLPADQEALYRTSGHGIRLAKGDDRVAVCTDCHGVHEIRAPDDPRSRVFPRNIPATCGGCHADGELIPGAGDGGPYQDYVAGVHGRAFLEEGNSSAPECTRCHGAHGATPPGFGDIDKVCGQCHTATRAHFIEGPHKAAMDAAGLPECASCHDHHRIAPAGIDLLESVCSNCHEPGSVQHDIALTMSALYRTADEELDMAAERVDEAAAIPLNVEDYRARLKEGRTALIESLPVMHSLEISRVEDLTRRARSIASEVESEIGGKLEGRAWRNVGLMLFWFYLILTVAILIRFRRQAMAGAPR